MHDLYAFDAPANFRFPIVNQFLFKRCVSESDGIVCVSRATERRLQEVVPQLAATRTVVQIYNPVCVPELCPEQKAAAGCRPGKFILTVGQHRRNKNLLLLLKAYANLRNRNEQWRDCSLVVVGSDGPETPALHALTAELGLRENVLYLSRVDDSELAWLYRNCLVIALPSSHEGLCMPLIEAVRSGARAVCSDIPVLRELGMPVVGLLELRRWKRQDAGISH